MKIKTSRPLSDNRAEITKRIANFWDKISDGWQEVWGPHIHHGYYVDDEPISPVEAQERLIEELAFHANIGRSETVLDAGCGLGGSSIYLAKRFGAKVTGVTLSPVQAEIAASKAVDAGVQNISFKIEDAVALKSFKKNSFGLVWSLESCEQFYDKPLFVEQAMRVLRKKGKLVLATWCSECDEYDGQEANAYYKLCNAFDLPYMPSPFFYYKTLKACGFKILSVFDWTRYVEKSWDIGISLVGAYSIFKVLRKAGIRGFIFTKQLRLMQQAYEDKMIKYMVFIGAK